MQIFGGGLIGRYHFHQQQFLSADHEHFPETYKQPTPVSALYT